MERSTIFSGYINYVDWAMFNSYVKLPEGIWKYMVNQYLLVGGIFYMEL